MAAPQRQVMGPIMPWPAGDRRPRGGIRSRPPWHTTRRGAGTLLRSGRRSQSCRESAARKASSTRSLRLQVRREDDQLLERHLDLLARRQREEIVPVFQRNDPAVQQLGRLDPLAAEVVDQQAAAIALHLQRRFADIAERVVADFQAVHRQFAADDDGGPANLHPAAVVCRANFTMLDCRFSTAS